MVEIQSFSSFSLLLQIHGSETKTSRRQGLTMSEKLENTLQLPFEQKNQTLSLLMPQSHHYLNPPPDLAPARGSYVLHTFASQF